MKNFLVKNLRTIGYIIGLILILIGLIGGQGCICEPSEEEIAFNSLIGKHVIIEGDTHLIKEAWYSHRWYYLYDDTKIREDLMKTLEIVEDTNSKYY